MSKQFQFELWQECNNICEFCVIPNTKILMSDYSYKNIQDINVGDIVMGMKSGNGERFKLIPTKVLNTGNREYTGKIYGSFTPEHPILSVRPSRNKYVLAKDSQTQIYPIVPNINPPITDNYKLGYIVGCFRGDGSYKKYKEKERFYNVKKRIRKNGKRKYINEYVTQKFNSHFVYRIRFWVKDTDITNKLNEYLNYFNDYFYTKFATIKNTKRKAIFANTKIAYEWLLNIIKKNLLKNDNQDYCKGFLAGIYDCEGNISKNLIRISQNAGDTLKEIERCVKILGYKYKLEDYRKCKTIRIYSKDGLKFIEDVCPGCKRKWYKRDTHNFIVQKGKLSVCDYSGIVYNFETETNNYIANNIVVHNCYLGQENRRTADEIKLNNLSRLKSMILDKDFDYDNISLIGGEFFQGQLRNPEVKKAFFEVIDIIFDKMDKGDIKSSWIAATLTIGDQLDLYELLEKYSKTSSYKKYDNTTNNGLWICTSYDTIGRFHTKDAENNWKYHMKRISELYPNVKKNTCSIMTEDLMQKYINNEILFEDFCCEYKTSIFFKPPDYGLLNDKKLMEERIHGFFPKKKTAKIFFAKLILKEKDMVSKIMNNMLRSDMLIKNYNDGNLKYCERLKYKKDEYHSSGDELLPCGHNKFYQAYVDSDDCIKCDFEELKNLL